MYVCIVDDIPNTPTLSCIDCRYQIPFNQMSGDEIVFEVARKLYKGNSISAADRLLSDFRKGFLGFGSLEAPIDGQKWPIQRIEAEISRDEEEEDDEGELLIGSKRLVGIHRFGKQQEVSKETKGVDALDSSSSLQSGGEDEIEDDSANSKVDSGSPLIGNVGRGKYEGW